MVLATKGQLTIAYNQGYEICACGWVSDKNAYYPMQAARKGCGSRGINNCGNSGPNDVFCYKYSAKGKFYKPNTTLLKQPKERFYETHTILGYPYYQKYQILNFSLILLPMLTIINVREYSILIESNFDS